MAQKKGHTRVTVNIPDAQVEVLDERIKATGFNRSDLIKLDIFKANTAFKQKEA